MMLDLSKECKFVRLSNSVAAGTTTVTTSIFNLQGQASAGVVSGATSVQPAGFDGICILIAFNTATSGAVLTATIQDNSLNSAGAMANVTASYAEVSQTNASNATVVQNSTTAGLTITDVGGNSSNELFMIDVVLVQLQFYQIVLARSVANLALDGVFGILYRSRERPVIHDTTVGGRGYFVASS